MQFTENSLYHFDQGQNGDHGLFVLRRDALAAQPRKILEQDILDWNTLHRAMKLQEFAGVPVLIVDTDQAPKDRDGFYHYMMDRLGKMDHVAEPHLRAGFHYFEDDLHCFLREEKLYGYVPPCAACYPFNQKATAAIILAPGAGCNPERDLLYGMDAKRPGPDPLLPGGNVSWRYFQLFHELAHVAGAKEPQADHIANLFCRRAFPDSPVPYMQADIRAMEAVTGAAKLATGNVHDAQDFRAGLEKYGWPMVVANDTANALAASDIAALTEDGIVAHHRTPYRQNADRLFTLGALIRNAGLDEAILSGCTGDIKHGARKLESRIDSLTGDSELRHMAGRFALAARRIHGGASSYANPAKPDLFVPGPR